MVGPALFFWFKSKNKIDSMGILRMRMMPVAPVRKELYHMTGAKPKTPHHGREVLSCPAIFNSIDPILRLLIFQIYTAKCLIPDRTKAPLTAEQSRREKDIQLRLVRNVAGGERR